MDTHTTLGVPSLNCRSRSAHLLHYADSDPSPATPAALAVDLDGSLVKSDLLWESYFGLLGRSPLRAVWLLRHLLSGVAAFKREVAASCPIDAASLPYREAVVDAIRHARAEGRRVVLATAADQTYAHAIASELGVFDDVVATENAVNQRGAAKAERLATLCPEGFDYIGDSNSDLPVWRRSTQALVVAPSASLLRRVRRCCPQVTVLDSRTSLWKTLLKLFRVKQWVKNLLLFLPIIAAQRLGDAAALGSVLFGFAAMSCCASATYVVNDLTDIGSDRRHPTKRRRPLASGDLSIQSAVFGAAALMCVAFLLAAAVGPAFAIGLLGYVVATFAYSSVVKSRMFADVLMLSSFYTYRVMLGGVASGIWVSHWLLLFCSFIFMSLALAKRYAELRDGFARNAVNSRRGYRIDDLPVLSSLGVTCGVLAVFVLCNYIAGPTAVELYRSPQWLWVAAPAILYWIVRLWFLAQRGELCDDPLVFASRDVHTFVVAAVVAASLLTACFAPSLPLQWS